MKQNKYDEAHFFTRYAQMPRSTEGLKAAGEWHVWQAILPNVHNKEVLDLGCGFGWHCRYVRGQQASAVIGVDLSEKMLRRAREMTDDPAITYIRSAIEDVVFPPSRFDVVISSLALHYVEPFAKLCQNIFAWLKPGGAFIFSVEHPIFTSRAEQDWHYDERGDRAHWPVDHYQAEGLRNTSFLSDNVIKYHRTVSTYLNSVIAGGFTIRTVLEPAPSPHLLDTVPGMRDELRRPMFLMIDAVKHDTDEGEALQKR